MVAVFAVSSIKREHGIQRMGITRLSETLLLIT